MSKIGLGPNVFLYPNPVTLLGTMIDGKANFMALGWVSRVNYDPPYIGASVSKSNYTPQGILEAKTFSINCPSVDMVESVDYCGIVSGKKRDKSGVFDLFFGELETAPMISDCPLCLECTLVETVDFPSNYFFIGEIAASYTEEQYLTDGSLDIKKINPLLLTMPDNRYWAVGEFVARAWNAGKNFKKEQ